MSDAANADPKVEEFKADPSVRALRHLLDQACGRLNQEGKGVYRVQSIDSGNPDMPGPHLSITATRGFWWWRRSRTILAAFYNFTANREERYLKVFLYLPVSDLLRRLAADYAERFRTQTNARSVEITERAPFDS